MLVGKLVSGLDWFNQRHPWSHNDHYHRWILERLPARRRTALDVGCGRGVLAAKLVPHFEHVVAIDADADMAAASRVRLGAAAEVRHADFLDITGRFDLVTMVAVLHHLDLEAALVHAKTLLQDAGTLLVVGLARPATPQDFAYDLTSAVLNPLVGLVKHPRAVVGAGSRPDFPVADPTLSFDEISDRAGAVLPGVRMKRRLFFRYTLAWTKPSPAL